MPDIDDIWDDDEDMLSHPMGVKFRIAQPDEQIEQAMRNMDREIKTATSRPSNHHGSNPRRSK
jgi:hypothetical protein